MTVLLRFKWRRSFSSLSSSLSQRHSDQVSNITPAISALIGRDLHRQQNHPICIVKDLVKESFLSTPLLDQLPPIVKVKNNFDDLLIPTNHVSRSPSDTFYVDSETVLRTHTSAHQTDLIKSGYKEFLLCGDCYRRDEIDASHYPAFHQIEGVRLFPQSSTSEQEVIHDLKTSLETTVKHVLSNSGPEGEDLDVRWIDAYFPFTHPSFEMEVLYRGKWLEILGCGAIHPGVFKSAGVEDQGLTGWAFGIGLERLAMAMFDIPDIRLFWSQDDRFLSQFRSGDRSVRFEAYSKYPPCIKDISFWIPQGFVENDLFAYVRETAGDLVESVALVDQFNCKQTSRSSRCYRITYRSMDRNLTNNEVDAIQDQLRQHIEQHINVQLR